MNLKRLIEIADAAYDSGDGENLVSRYHNSPHDDSGDSLARFIAIELSETFDSNSSDEEQLNTAASQIQRAIDQLTNVLDAFEQKTVDKRTEL